MKQIIILSFYLFLFSCSKVTPKDSGAIDEDYSQYIISQSQYVVDRSSDFFLEKPWYVYDESNHIIWPMFNVYSVRAKGEYFKFQIIDYYNNRSIPGEYTIRLQRIGDRPIEWTFNAAGCGNVYTNLNYEKCMQNPKTNVYTYLRLSDQSSFKTSNTDAITRMDWDIAFNGTEVKMNAGSSGPGKVRVAHIYTYKGFFPGGAVDFQKLAEVSFSSKGSEFFHLNLDIKNAPFSLPLGVDRVINEPDWFQKSKTITSLFEAVHENWWLLRGAEGDTYSKVNIAKINETIETDGSVTSVITFDYFHQGAGDKRFQSDKKSWTLPAFSSNQRLLKWCLDFDSEQVVSCSWDKEIWDIRLSVSNRRGKRRWRINVAKGAIGPLLYDDMISRKHGDPETLIP